MVSSDLPEQAANRSIVSGTAQEDQASLITRLIARISELEHKLYAGDLEDHERHHGVVLMDHSCSNQNSVSFGENVGLKAFWEFSKEIYAFSERGHDSGTTSLDDCARKLAAECIIGMTNELCERREDVSLLRARFCELQHTCRVASAEAKEELREVKSRLAEAQEEAEALATINRSLRDQCKQMAATSPLLKELEMENQILTEKTAELAREAQEARGSLRDAALATAHLELSLASAQEEAQQAKELLAEQHSLQEAAMRQLQDYEHCLLQAEQGKIDACSEVQAATSRIDSLRRDLECTQGALLIVEQRYLEERRHRRLVESPSTTRVQEAVKARKTAAAASQQAVVDFLQPNQAVSF
eukprot:jgi/Botrbrau1/12121/Bobra.0186s0039.1